MAKMDKMRTLHGRQATSISEIRAGRDEQGQVSATCAFVPLSFELGHAFQFDWSEEGLVIGGIDRQTQAPSSQRPLPAGTARWRSFQEAAVDVTSGSHDRSLKVSST
jgi:hypothetical protein